MRRPFLIMLAGLSLTLTGCGGGYDTAYQGSRQLRLFVTVPTPNQLHVRITVHDADDDDPSIRRYTVCIRERCGSKSVGLFSSNTQTVIVPVTEFEVGDRYTAKVKIDVRADRDLAFRIDGLIREGDTPSFF